MEYTLDYAICSDALTRRFGKSTVVNALDLRVQTGTITAFLGPNGAGKTTTIRMLLGLIKPHVGNAEVLGHPAGHPAALAQTGAMVESPSLYEHLTGLENLKITRLMRNLPPSAVDRVLKLVDMARDARRPVRDYSLGMRQRMGVALALMGEPRLLILDEPTNGLDPAGIQDMRELICSLPQETGATVFLSSHILAEVEQVASNVVVIHRGSLRYQGATEGLGTPGPAQIVVRVDDPARAIPQLEAQGFHSQQEGTRLWIQAAGDEAPRIAACLVGAGLALYEMEPHRVNLEARFLALLEEA